MWQLRVGFALSTDHRPRQRPAARFTMVPPIPTPLLTLQDVLAPYRGHWHFQRSGADLLMAVHTTDHPDRAPECVIEHRQFGDRVDAMQFARHLLQHGWAIEQLHASGESLLVASSL
ncbi:MAG: hypothetical protein ACKO0M_13660 [Cyanobium sp.]